MMLKRQEKRQKAVLLAGLYTSQTLGLGFVTTAVPVILRQSGAGLDKISWIFALGFFWSLKFLWAPLVDRYGSKKLGHYRGWIIVLQILMIIVTVAASCFSVNDRLPFLFVLFAMLTFLSATQDIASDGLSVTLLKPEERCVGSSIQSGGNMLGYMIAGGILLMVYQWLGWSGSLLVLAGGMALPLIGILKFPEPESLTASPKNKAGYKAFIRFFKRPGIWGWIPVLLIFRINHQITYWLLNPFLVDLGWSIDRIGFTLNIFGLLISIAGAAAGGVMVNYYGRKKTMLASMAFGILGTAGFIGLNLDYGGAVSIFIYVILGVIMATGGISNTAIYTVIMDKCDPDNAATDFTLQWSLSGVSAMVGGGLAMASAEFIGYAGVLFVSVGFAVTAIYLIWRYNDFESGHKSDLSDCKNLETKAN